LAISKKFASTQTTPFTPHSALYAMWMSQKHLSGYSQQDAHEFFISLLDEIHKNCTTTSSHESVCNCIIHKSFGGLLQSDLTCTSCGNVSLTNDPFLDLSLEIKVSDSKPPPAKKKKLQNDENEPAAVPVPDEYTLQECLEEFIMFNLAILCQNS
jgi:ubiquitin carboxyl-terminal hydrolase 22/27/51